MHMKPAAQKRFAFMGKSMLWSLLFYVVLMLAFNWDEVSRSIKGNDGVTIINAPADQPAQAQASSHTRMAKTLFMLLKTVSGFTLHTSGAQN
jgi:hypothetical protein